MSLAFSLLLAVVLLRLLAPQRPAVEAARPAALALLLAALPGGLLHLGLDALQLQALWLPLHLLLLLGVTLLAQRLLRTDAPVQNVLLAAALPALLLGELDLLTQLLGALAAAGGLWLLARLFDDLLARLPGNAAGSARLLCLGGLCGLLMLGLEGLWR